YDLAVIYTQLLSGLEDAAFGYDALSDYFKDNLHFEISNRASTDGNPPESSTTIFPMPPAITLTSSDGKVNVNYNTDSVLMVNDGYEEKVQDYFNTFDVHYQNSLEKREDQSASLKQIRRQARMRNDGTPETMTRFVFRDYFLLLTRGAVQASI